VNHAKCKVENSNGKIGKNWTRQGKHHVTVEFHGAKCKRNSKPPPLYNSGALSELQKQKRKQRGIIDG
jgi:hypothetical protein